MQWVWLCLDWCHIQITKYNINWQSLGKIEQVSSTTGLFSLVKEGVFLSWYRKSVSNISKWGGKTPCELGNNCMILNSIRLGKPSLNSYNYKRRETMYEYVLP